MGQHIPDRLFWAREEEQDGWRLGACTPLRPTQSDQGDLLARAALVLEGGAQILQYRSKSPD